MLYKYKHSSQCIRGNTYNIVIILPVEIVISKQNLVLLVNTLPGNAHKKNAIRAE